MKKQLRSSFSTQGRRMAGARALWGANGMKKAFLTVMRKAYYKYLYRTNTYTTFLTLLMPPPRRE